RKRKPQPIVGRGSAFLTCAAASGGQNFEKKRSKQLVSKGECQIQQRHKEVNHVRISHPWVSSFLGVQAPERPTDGRSRTEEYSRTAAEGQKRRAAESRPALRVVSGASRCAPAGRNACQVRFCGSTQT